MKIGFTLDTLTSITGKERVVYELAKRLAKNHEVTIITFENRADEKVLKLFEREGINFYFLKYRGKLLGRFSYLTFYKKEISELNLDIINTHGLILANAAALSKIPTVKTYHAHVITLPEILSNPVRWIDYFLEESFSIYYANRIISISKYAKYQLKQLYHKSSVVIYNGVDTNNFKPNKKKGKSFREKLNISDDEVLIGNIGRFTKQKNQEFLIRLAKLPNFRLILVGDGPLKKFYQQLAKKLNVKIIFLHHVNERILQNFYNAIDIYAHPSLWESFGLPISACEKPVIAFNRTAMREVVLHNKTGFLANNEKEFYNYIKQLSKDASLRKALGCNGRRFAKQFSWKITAENYLNEFNKVITTSSY